MTDEEIEQLKIKIKDDNVHFTETFRYNYRTLIKCTHIIDDWVKIYPGGIRAAVSEPAVFFENGKCAALYVCSPEDFVYLKPVF